jgi:hypothetical protein
MRVLYDDGVAIRLSALSRASAAREGGGEASVGVVQAEAIEPRNGTDIRGADALVIGGRPCRQQRYRELLGDPARSENLGMYEALHAENREVPWSPVARGDAPSVWVRGVVGRWVAGREGNASAVSP